ncbi:Soluble lytic murein transglycosylase precursor [Pseudoalteromonas sp. P1-9]|uniref:transglycosylase SLT domain-containing protein n=1 Tax=Pseudoalteromonas sp. P1-9 TaxID=1710354 RepID=UPI0006D62D96|nr:transglycosylase SLT domain-containing protein [Pseudoalteromonas sp. P1-9]KPV96202.1 Soluble lytic murein transglycosylase precursor [Pseudoalteromonas sp. P1-9]
MKKSVILTALVSLVLSSSALNASADKAAHKDFLALEKLAKKNDKRDFYRALKQSSHPLAPYAEATYLANSPWLANQQEIKKFLDTYQGTPLEWKVRYAWLDNLKKSNKKALYIDAYRPTRKAEYQCTYLNYQLQLGAPKEAIFNQVDELWSVAKSQPKECDVLFSKWKKAGHLNQELVWQRITKVSEKGNTSLLAYLSRLLPKNERYLADLYKTVRRDPSAAAGLYRFKKRTDKEGQIALYGVKRLVWRDRDLAIRAWQKLENMFDYTEQQKQSLYYIFALSLASGKHKEAKFYLNKVAPKRHDSKLMQWQLSNMLREEDWQGIIAYSTGKTLNNGYRYWLAYAYHKIGDAQRANQLWKELAKKRDYYGFLAASRLDLAVSLEYQPVVVDPQTQKLVSESPGFKRAKALYELDRFYSARREWNSLIAGSTDDEKLAAASLANDMGWHDSVIRVMSQLKAYNMLDYRFPTPYSDQFERYSSRSKVDKTWAYAISRRESSFASDAHSSAGAIGLMQLLPSTARYVNKGSVSRNQLKKPHINIRLGTQYLKYLKKKSKGNEVIATASYNAGYHKVKRWLPQEAVDFDLWVEAIPYRETREYVKNVYAYRQVYATRSGNKENLFDELISMKIKR